MERYRTQAERCDVGVLFGAISLLTEADSNLRTASNQRLLVELTLMKIAAIGQKKNSGLNLPEEVAYPLPSLDQQPQQVVNKSVAAPQQVAAPVATPPTPAPTVAAQPVVEKEVAEVVPTPAPTVAPTPQPAPTPAPQSATTASVGGRTRRAGSGVIPGGSLTSLLNRINGTGEGETVGEYRIDPESEAKLTAAREQIIKEMAIERPRFNAAFDNMRIEGNKIHVVVHAATLENDLRQSKSEILDHIAEIAQIDGILELEIELQEIEVRLRPVKLEDRVRHIEQSTPNFNRLRELLDLEAD